jgi:hypothetical protein
VARLLNVAIAVCSLGLGPLAGHMPMEKRCRLTFALINKHRSNLKVCCSFLCRKVRDVTPNHPNILSQGELDCDKKKFGDMRFEFSGFMILHKGRQDSIIGKDTTRNEAKDNHRCTNASCTRLCDVNGSRVAYNIDAPTRLQHRRRS